MRNARFPATRSNTAAVAHLAASSLSFVAPKSIFCIGVAQLTLRWSVHSGCDRSQTPDSIDAVIYLATMRLISRSSMLVFVLSTVTQILSRVCIPDVKYLNTHVSNSIRMCHMPFVPCHSKSTCDDAYCTTLYTRQCNTFLMSYMVQLAAKALFPYEMLKRPIQWSLPAAVWLGRCLQSSWLQNDQALKHYRW